MKSIIIRADASKDIGFGHFIRSLALAGYLKDDFKCYFCTFNPIDFKPSLYQKTEISTVAEYIPIDAKSYEEYDNKFIESLTGNEIVVLDNYYYTTSFQQQIKKKGCKLVYIGAINDRHYVADAIITFGEKTSDMFSLEPYTQYLSGLNHTFLRKPFLNGIEYSNRNSKITNIVLAVGGADPYSLSNKLIGLILEINPELHISVIAGDTVELNPKILSKVDVYRRLSGEEIVELFSKSDLGIFSASTICVEALACKLPVAAGWYVDNQKDFYKFGVREGLFLSLGNFLDKDNILKKRLGDILKDKSFAQQRDNIDFIKGRSDIITLFKNL